MTTVQLSASYGRDAYVRECDPAGAITFTDDPTSPWLVQASFVASVTETRAMKAHRILVITEPAGYFPSDFVNQFGILISPFAIRAFQGEWIQDHGALPSFLGVRFAGKSHSIALSLSDIMSMEPPAKSDDVSAVTSGKVFFAGHRQRLRLLGALQTSLGARLHVYGRGVRPIEDKSEAILPHRYHLVLENTVMPAYWTEKLADAWLGYAYPFVVGPPDLDRWFPRGSFTMLDPSDPAGATTIILNQIERGLSDAQVNAVAEARRRVLEEQRLNSVVGRIVGSHSEAPMLTEVKLIAGLPKPPLMNRIGRESRRLWWTLANKMRPAMGARS